MGNKKSYPQGKSMKNNIYFKSQVKKSKVIHRGAIGCTTPWCNQLHPEINKDFEKRRAHVRTHTREVSRRAGNREVIMANIDTYFDWTSLKH